MFSKVIPFIPQFSPNNDNPDSLMYIVFDPNARPIQLFSKEKVFLSTLYSCTKLVSIYYILKI